MRFNLSFENWRDRKGSLAARYHKQHHRKDKGDDAPPRRVPTRVLLFVLHENRGLAEALASSRKVVAFPLVDLLRPEALAAALDAVMNDVALGMFLRNERQNKQRKEILKCLPDR